MEEKKETKEVKLAPKKAEAADESKKLSYEEVCDIANRLIAENRQLKQSLEKASGLINSFNRLDYLFMVLDRSSVINDPDFILSCVEEIKDFMTIKEPSKEEGGKE